MSAWGWIANIQSKRVSILGGQKAFLYLTHFLNKKDTAWCLEWKEGRMPTNTKHAELESMNNTVLGEKKASERVREHEYTVLGDKKASERVRELAYTVLGDKKA